MPPDFATELMRLAAATQSEVKTLRTENNILKHQYAKAKQDKDQAIVERNEVVSKLEEELRLARQTAVEAATPFDSKDARLELMAAHAGIEDVLQSLETHGNQTQRKRRHKVEADEDAEQRQSARKKTKTTKVAKPLEHIVASKTGILQPVILSTTVQSYIDANHLSLEGRRVVKEFSVFDVFGPSTREIISTGLPDGYETPRVISPSLMTVAVSAGELELTIDRGTTKKIVIRPILDGRKNTPGECHVNENEAFVIKFLAPNTKFILTWHESKETDEATIPDAHLTFQDHLHVELSRVQVFGGSNVNVVQPNELFFSKVYDFLLKDVSSDDAHEPDAFIFLSLGKVENLLQSDAIDGQGYKLVLREPKGLPILVTPFSGPGTRNREVLVRGRMCYEALARAHIVAQSARKMRDVIHTEWLLEPITRPFCEMWVEQARAKKKALLAT